VNGHVDLAAQQTLFQFFRKKTSSKLFSGITQAQIEASIAGGFYDLALNLLNPS